MPDLSAFVIVRVSSGARRITSRVLQKKREKRSNSIAGMSRGSGLAKSRIALVGQLISLVIL